jgi:hypothetical protein
MNKFFPSGSALLKDCHTIGHPYHKPIHMKFQALVECKSEPARHWLPVLPMEYTVFGEKLMTGLIITTCGQLCDGDTQKVTGMNE